MKVIELIELLKTLPEDTQVILSKDSEGNSYSPLSSVAVDMVYVPETTWCGEVYSITEDDKDEDHWDEEEWEELKNKPKCVVLWPT